MVLLAGVLAFVLAAVLAADLAVVLAGGFAVVLAAGLGDAGVFLAVFAVGLVVALRVVAAAVPCDGVEAFVADFFATFFAACFVGRTSLSPHNSSKR